MLDSGVLPDQGPNRLPRVSGRRVALPPGIGGITDGTASPILESFASRWGFMSEGGVAPVGFRKPGGCLKQRRP